MGSFLSDAGSLEFRAVLQRAASSGPFAQSNGVCRSRAQRLSFVADCVGRTILPRRIEFLIGGRRVLSLGARDGRLICIGAAGEPSHAASDEMEACSPQTLAATCDLIDQALETGEEITFTASAFEASTDTGGLGIAAAELFSAAETSPLPFSPFEALERVVAHHSERLLGVYYDPNSAAETEVSEDVPEEVATWVAHRVAMAGADQNAALDDELSLLVHPQGYCLALVGHLAEPLALLFEAGSFEDLVEDWARLRSKPQGAE